MDNVFKKIILVSKNIRRFLSENNNICVKRNRKNDIIDSLLYKFYYTKSGTTQEKACITLNKFKKSINRSSRQSLAKKEKIIPVSFYETLSETLATEINKSFNFCKKYTRQIVAVDGTFPTFLNTLKKDKFVTNKNGKSVTPLVTGLFNITLNYPITMELSKTKNERKAFIEFIKFKDKFKDNTFVFDRGYYGEDFYKNMYNNGLSFICRLKESDSYVSDEDDKECETSDGHTIRIVRYKINNNSYYLATNVFDYSIDLLKQIYHDRWTVEEYYKYIKHNMKLDKVNEKRECDIRKTIASHVIVSQLAYMFANIDHPKKINGKVINKSILSEGLYDEFLFNFFNNSKFTKCFLTNFFKIYVKYIKTSVGTSTQRICNRPNFRWYFKKYFKNVKFVNI